MTNARKVVQGTDDFQSIPVSSLYLKLSRLGRQTKDRQVLEKIEIIVNALHQEKTDKDPLSFHVSHSVKLSKHDVTLLFPD